MLSTLPSKYHREWLLTANFPRISIRRCFPFFKNTLDRALLTNEMLYLAGFCLHDPIIYHMRNEENNKPNCPTASIMEADSMFNQALASVLVQSGLISPDRFVQNPLWLFPMNSCWKTLALGQRDHDPLPSLPKFQPAPWSLLMHTLQFLAHRQQLFCGHSAKVRRRVCVSAAHGICRPWF